jgi:toxin ParE1/3/4
MGTKSIVPHRHAIDDALDAVDYYRENAGIPIAESFSLAVDEALEQVGQHPNIGSPRPAFDLDIEGIKSWALKRFPHQIYYRVLHDRVELCRVLHPKRDINQACCLVKGFNKG